MTPESVVQRQLDAYNARDLNALLDVYASDAEVYEHPSTLVAKGVESLRARYSERFREPNLHAQLVSRVVLGSTVVDHEIVTRTFSEGPGTIELVMIYEVAGSHIAKAWTIAGLKRVFHPS